MKLFSRRRFIDRIALTAAAAPLLQSRHLAISDISQPEAGFGGNRPERFIASRNMAEFWTSFARTGKPSAVGTPDWVAYDLRDRPTMRIDTKCEVIHNRYSIELDMWRSIGKLR